MSVAMRNIALFARAVLLNCDALLKLRRSSLWPSISPRIRVPQHVGQAKIAVLFVIRLDGRAAFGQQLVWQERKVRQPANILSLRVRPGQGYPRLV